MTPVSLRAGRPDDAVTMRGIHRRAKSSHGYTDAQMEQFAAEVTETLTSDLIASNAFVIAEQAGNMVGFAGVLDTGDPETLHLEYLFIDPDAQGSGIGRRLFEWAVEEATARGVAALEFHSDPHVTGFYDRLGATRVGETPSSVIEGWSIPKYRYELPAI